jgi:hypothetical protein
MTTKRTRAIPGTTINGITRGGGSETIEYATDGPMLLNRSFNHYTTGHGIHPGGQNVGANLGAVSYISVPSLQTSIKKSDATIRANGTSAMKWTRPLSPTVSILTSAGELYLDGIPLLPRVAMWRKETLKALSNAHLSVQFGWLPIAADIKAYCRQVRSFNAILKEADASSTMERIAVGHTWPIERTTEAYQDSYVTYNWMTGNSTGNPARTFVTKERMQKTWFEAKYLQLPPLSPRKRDKFAEFAHKADVLLGLQLTPEVVWNLTPWTWLVDWFTNAGDIVSIISENLNDSLVMSNGFVMNHHRLKAEAFRPGPVPYGPKPSVLLYSGGDRSIAFNETKSRFVAVPYFGFGTVGELTNRQLSILAALGLSRAK